MNFEVIDKVDGGDNMGGTQSTFYMFKASDVLTWPTVPAVPTDLADKVTIADDFVFKTGKRMWPVYVTDGKNSVDSKGVGEMDGRSFEHIGEVVHPGNTKQFAGLMQEVNNTDTVVIMLDAEAQMRVIGSKAFPAKVSDGETTTGKQTADFKHNKLIFKSKGNGPAPYYEGALQLTPAT